MLKRFIAPALLASVALLATRGTAQPGPGGPGGIGGMTPEQMQQMQDFQQKMMQNMQDKGIDPQEFFGGMAQGMQDGTLDPADIQQMMMDKGIIDPDMAAQMQKMQTDMQTAQTKTQVDSLKDQLGATDAEWTALQVRIQKVLDCMAVLGQNAQVGRMGGFGGGQPTASDLAKALKDLRAAIKTTTTSDDDVKAKIKSWRDAHEKAKNDLVSAQKDLTDLLTPRQEAILTNLGIL
jgi:Spy/CpxP family protein refolding chaperone